MAEPPRKMRCAVMPGDRHDIRKHPRRFVAFADDRH